MNGAIRVEIKPNPKHLNCFDLWVNGRVEMGAESMIVCARVAEALTGKTIEWNEGREIADAILLRMKEASPPLDFDELPITAATEIVEFLEQYRNFPCIQRLIEELS